jgi:hypothetical protein
MAQQPTTAAPEPSRAAVPLPGLESDPPNTVLPEDCAVSLVAGHVSVDLAVSTAADSPALLLEGAFFGWGGAGVAYPDRHFPELTIHADDAPGPPQDNFEAFMGGRNITLMLKMAGIDPWAITRTPPLTAAHADHPQMLKGLSNIGAIEKSGDDYLAKWQARRIIRIPLKVVAQQRLQLDYSARPATAVMTVSQLDTTARERSECLTPDSLRRLPHTAGGPAWLATEYVIPTGIDGKPPKSVTLTVTPGAGPTTPAHTYLFVCGPHGKPIAKRDKLTHERVEVDDSGTLKLLSLTESAQPAPLTVR